METPNCVCIGDRVNETVNEICEEYDISDSNAFAAYLVDKGIADYETAAVWAEGFDDIHVGTYDDWDEWAREELDEDEFEAWAEEQGVDPDNEQKFYDWAVEQADERHLWAVRLAGSGGPLYVFKDETRMFG